MNKFMNIILLIISSTISEQALSEIIYFTGEISTISATESLVALDGPSIVLEGVVNNGLCLASSNKLSLIIKDDSRGKAQYSLAISAMMANRQVTIEINDSLRDPGNRCYLRSISINNE